ncbi:MAG: hypothetical protein IPH09_13315 [bacterium]|nr:hypothetical protein [bacterium]
MTISGSNLYVTDIETGLQVIDITNPANPQMVGNVDTPWYASGVAVTGDYALVATGFSGFYIFPAQCDLYAIGPPSLSDVPNDQGGQLTVSWQQHYSDSPSALVPVTEYDIQRLGANWQTLTTVEATQADSYQVAVPTDDIMTLDQPLPFSHYRIVARTVAPVHLYTSLPDSGYSIDNLPPDTRYWNFTIARLHASLHGKTRASQTSMKPVSTEAQNRGLSQICL